MILWLISRLAGSAMLNQELKYTQLLLSGESCPKVLALAHWKSYYFFPVISPWKPNPEFIFYHSTTPGIAGASRNFLQVCDCWFWLWLGFAAKIYSHCTSELCFYFANLGVLTHMHMLIHMPRIQSWGWILPECRFPFWNCIRSTFSKHVTSY